MKVGDLVFDEVFLQKGIVLSRKRDDVYALAAGLYEVLFEGNELAIVHDADVVVIDALCPESTLLLMRCSGKNG